MATNEILQFASTNTGTNLLTQAEYAADAQRTTGNQPGIARSKLVNKSLRQTSLLAAGLAEFIADYQANNVTDSLTPQNIADYLAAAITAAFPAATETLQGKVELATNAEVQVGSDTSRAITPAGLSSRTATETRSGVIEIATSAEAVSGVSDSVTITPLKLRNALNAAGNPPIYATRAWVNFDGSQATPTIRQSGNVSSITDVSTGIYWMNFAVNMPHNQYAINITEGGSLGPAEYYSTGAGEGAIDKIKIYVGSVESYRVDGRAVCITVTC